MLKLKQMLLYRQFANQLLDAFVQTNCKTPLATKIQMIYQVGKKIFQKIIFFNFLDDKIEILKNRDDQIREIHLKKFSNRFFEWI